MLFILEVYVLLREFCDEGLLLLQLLEGVRNGPSAIFIVSAMSHGYRMDKKVVATEVI